MLTETVLAEFIKKASRYASEPRVMFVHPRVKKVLDDWARTSVLDETATYRKYELDGRVWWARLESMAGSSGFWPRYDPEVWGARQIYNRHWRRRGYA